MLLTIYRNISITKKSGEAHGRRFAPWCEVLFAILAMHVIHEPVANAQVADAPTCPAPAERDWWEFGFSDYVLNENVLLALGHTWMQAADVSEVLETAARIDEEDPDSWTREWHKTAERLIAVGEESEAHGHPISAGHAYLRAATYLRTGLARNFYPGSAEVAAAAGRQAECFSRYLALTDSPCKAVEIPYEKTTLPGYFCRAPQAVGHAPVIVFNSGRDVWAEDAKLVADEALKRGYHALLYDGPGQGRALRRQGLPFRPDWENVVTPVVDFVLAQQGVDPQRIALWGESMGGYLVPRAAAYEHRLKAIIANPGVVDWYQTTAQQVEMLFPELFELLGEDDAAFDAQAQALMASSNFNRWALQDAMWKHGVDTPSALFHDFARYRLGGAVKRIRARTLVVDAEAEDRGQARELYDALRTRKDFLLFTAAEAAQFHDQPGAKAIASQRMFDWLDEALKTPHRRRRHEGPGHK